jgi:hypothetical protein
MIKVIKEGTAQWQALVSAGLLLVPGTSIRDIFGTTAIRDEPCLSYHVFKFNCIKLGKAPLLQEVDPLMARELELGPV